MERVAPFLKVLVSMATEVFHDGPCIFSVIFHCSLVHSPHCSLTGFSLVSETHQALSCLLFFLHRCSLCLERSYPSVSHDEFLSSFCFLETSSLKTPCKALLSPSHQLISYQVSQLFPSWHLLSETAWFISSFTSLLPVYPLEISSMMVRMLSCPPLYSLSLAQYSVHNKFNEY